VHFGFYMALKSMNVNSTLSLRGALSVTRDVAPVSRFSVLQALPTLPFFALVNVSLYYTTLATLFLRLTHGLGRYIE
jgi:tartrate dehydratase beta subunit/fumarate hydratase class I family protein